MLKIKIRSIRLDWLVVEFALEFLVLGDFSHGLHKVLVDYIVTFGSNSKHTGLCANIPQVSAVKAV